ncbi:helix-turn-helix domain-containing protein [Vibrio sp. T187]|uniref:GlxA family transcriptional regulator n=1 Tax=Vibrio TaxID=662 RepID=UPI0010C9D35B|nr:MULTISPECIES: helix-turn-helix domain-containing protein [Vibrio]MBW3698266.1 helix-turn-helix domain-containing protein [Vibrio sp. T187]
MSLHVAIVNYQDSLKSALHGLEELFLMANLACEEQGLGFRFEPVIIDIAHDLGLGGAETNDQSEVFDIVLLPPSNSSDYYLEPCPSLVKWLQEQASQGAILCSACAGAFILAKTGLLNHRKVTTHWGLAPAFAERFPELTLDTDKILINESDVITAGGMMSWIDLGLELVGQYSQPSVMRQLGKMLVVDTGTREQRYYKQFTPVYNHGDDLILKVQKWILQHVTQQVTLVELAEYCCLGERTFLRRFKKATGLNPTEYMQNLRVQKICELLETSSNSFEWIVHQVGYEDASACRKLFLRIMGLTPQEFRKRFVNS